MSLLCDVEQHFCLRYSTFNCPHSEPAKYSRPCVSNPLPTRLSYAAHGRVFELCIYCKLNNNIGVKVQHLL
jgi:hypothetical protein